MKNAASPELTAPKQPVTFLILKVAACLGLMLKRLEATWYEAGSALPTTVAWQLKPVPVAVALMSLASPLPMCPVTTPSVKLLAQ